MKTALVIAALISSFAAVNLASPAQAVQPTTFPRDGGESKSGSPYAKDKFTVVENGSAKNGRGGLAKRRTFASKPTRRGYLSASSSKR